MFISECMICVRYVHDTHMEEPAGANSVWVAADFYTCEIINTTTYDLYSDDTKVFEIDPLLALHHLFCVWTKIYKILSQAMKYCTGGQWWVWLPLICRDGVTVLPIPPMFQYRSSLLLAFLSCTCGIQRWKQLMDLKTVFNPLVGFEPSGSVCYISAVTLSDSHWRIHILDQQLGNSVNYSETQPRRWITRESLWCNIMYRRPVQCHTVLYIGDQSSVT